MNVARRLARLSANGIATEVVSCRPFPRFRWLKKPDGTTVLQQEFGVAST
jgi:hypothetical protein